MIKNIQNIFEGKIYGIEKIYLAIFLVLILIIYLHISISCKYRDNFIDTPITPLPIIPITPSSIAPITTVNTNKQIYKKFTKETKKLSNLLIKQTKNIIYNTKKYFKIN